MNEAPRSIRLQIAIFGKRNAGKSSLINAITNQDLAVVSSIAGTTTDPVLKSMEISPLGPVTIIDTPGIDDEGELGKLRAQKAQAVISKTNVILLVIAANSTPSHHEESIVSNAIERKIPVIGVISKIDLVTDTKLIENWFNQYNIEYCQINSINKSGIDTLKQLLVKNSPIDFQPETIVGDLIKPLDTVILICPVDAGAPKSRLILPQVQVLRDILDNGGIAIVITEKEIEATLAKLKEPPALVITDSQVFAQIAPQIPINVPLTSFSILFARYKGDLAEFMRGIEAIRQLTIGDNVLIAEACTHYASHEDIGRVKIPRWLEKTVGGKLNFSFAVGGEFVQDLTKYKLIVHCGGCMINRAEVLSRIKDCQTAKVPVVNYGILIGHMTGILERVMQPINY